MTDRELTPQYTHLYYERHLCWDGCWTFGNHDCYEVMACPVTRVTAKRIYFRGSDSGPKYLRDREWFVNRADMERGVYHRGFGTVLHLEPPQRESRRVQSVSELRREAAELHPDRGGDPAAFRAAYARYARAKAATR